LGLTNIPDPVPPKSELKTLERANMAVAKIPKEVSEPSAFIGDNGEFGPPLFAKLVPFAVHVAASIYEERRDRLVNTNIIEELEVLTTKIHDTLSSLNLPGSLQALEKPLGLPPSLTSHAEEIRQADALSRLQRSFSDTAKLKASDDAIFAEGRELLQAENSENERLRMKYGTDRWTRAPSKSAAAKLWAQIDEISGYLQSAGNSDQLVISKFRECEDMLLILSKPDRDIGSFVPSSRRVTIPPKLENEVSRLRNSLNEVSRLESRRRRKIEALREKAKKDDINTSILAEAARLEREYPSQTIVAAHFEDFFEQRLTKYESDLAVLQTESDEQDRLTSQLEAANASFVAARKGDTSSREREQALQKLENAYFKYKEIVSNLEVGRKFYNDLAKIVGRFRDACKAFVYERREEAMRLESYVFSFIQSSIYLEVDQLTVWDNSDLSLPPLSSLSLQENIPQAGIPRTYNTRSSQPPQQQQRPSLSPHSSYRDDAIPAPVPQRVSVAPMTSPPIMPAMWNPEMGIKFGGMGPPPNQNQNQNQGQGQGGQRSPGWQPPPGSSGGTWDPNRGFTFG
jgi:programmed cell death 6-interacting protein